ncbi:MAG: ABC transporter [Propionibacterium sp.]|nr:MAG: ABC transporter [Propionibacterium sp.]
MKTVGTPQAILKQYRRLLTPEGEKKLTQNLLFSYAGGVVEALALFAVLLGATALATGEPALGLSAGGWVMVLALLAALGFLVGYLTARVSYQCAMDLMRNCHKVVGDKIAALPLGWFGVSEAGNYSRAMTNGMMQMGQALAHILSLMLNRIALVLVMVVGLWLWSPTLGLVLTISLPIQAAVVWLTGLGGYKIKIKTAPAAENLSTRIVEYAACQGALRSAGRSADAPQLSQAIIEEEKAGKFSLIAESVLLLIAGTVAQAVAVSLIYFATQLALGNSILGESLSGIEAVVFIGICLRLTHNIEQIGQMSVALQNQTPILNTISDILDAETMTQPAKTDPKPADSAVELEQVNFGYEVDTPVVRDISFKVAPNTMTALVGPSGSGKTTIARLISRFYDCDSGSIKIGGVDVKDFTTADLMAQLSMVFQDVYLFNDTLEANIRVGRPDASEAEVKAAAETAGVSEIVDRLPDGWNTQVGEGGGRLSGGERQRVSIARALLKGAPIVLVDEATSALDAENEANIARALEELRAKSTVLVIAHKLDTIRNADQIVVLDDEGRLAQLGTHDELVNQPGGYQHFWAQRELAAGWHLV